MAATTHKNHTNGHNSPNIGARDTIFGSIPRFLCPMNLLDGLFLWFDYSINIKIQYGRQIIFQNRAIAYFLVIDLHSAWGIPHTFFLSFPSHSCSKSSGEWLRLPTGHSNTEPKCHEYNEFNTRLCRKAGMLPQSKTDVAFLPLIDHPPAHYDTIKTAIDKGLTLMRAAGDDMLIFTADQQLYKIVNDIMFYQPTYFESVIPVLGGMYMVMNVIHATAVIMAGSEMNEILAGTFGSVEKMLSGKKYPQKLPSH